MNLSVPAPPAARQVHFIPRHAAHHAFCFVAAASVALASAAFAAVSDLRVEQTFTVTGTTYSVTPTLKISFNLSQASPVTVKISRHLARYEHFKWPYLAKPILVRELNQGTMGAGSQTITWDGLDQNGKTVVEEQNTLTEELAAMNLWTTASLEQLTQRPPVNLFQISVEAGGEKVFTNFERAVGTVRPNRMVRPLRMGVIDRDGSFLVSDFWGACVWRYSPDWAILGEYPKDHTFG